MAFLNLMKFINYLNKSKYFILFLIFGYAIFFAPMILSGFDLMPAMGYEIKISNYILEHSFLFIKGVEGHNSFYNAPFGAENVIANFDLHFVFMPFYWFFRLIFNPFSSLQALLFLVVYLNYQVFYLLTRKFKFSRFSSSLASFIFSFNLIRYYNFENIAYFSQFLTILALFCLLKTNTEISRMKKHVCFILFSVFVILQFYTCFSFGFFFIFALILFVLLSFIPKASRDVAISYFKVNHRFVFYYSIGIFLMLTPMIYHMVLNEKIIEILQLLSQIASFSSLFRSVSYLDNIFVSQPYISQYENLSLSYGILAFLAGVFGLLKLKKMRGVCALTLFAIVLLSCSATAFIFYRYAYYFIPFSENIKYIDNFLFMGLLFVSLGVASLSDYLKNNKKILFVVVLLLLLEQIPSNCDKNSPWKNYAWSKKEFETSINMLLDKIPQEEINVLLVQKRINADKYSKTDTEIKEERARKLLDAKAIWLSAYRPVKVLNSFVQKPQEEQKAKVYEIYVDIDYDKL